MSARRRRQELPRWRTEFIKGIGKRGNDLMIILDIDRVFNCLDLNAIQEAPSSPRMMEAAI